MYYFLKTIGYIILTIGAFLLLKEVFFKENRPALKTPKYFIILGVFLFVSFSLILLFSFTKEKVLEYSIKTIIGGIIFLICSGFSGLILIALYVNYRIIILEDKLIKYDIFGKKREIVISELSKNVLSSVKNEWYRLVLFDKNNKRIVISEFYTGNWYLLIKVLRSQKIKIQNETPKKLD